MAVDDHQHRSQYRVSLDLGQWHGVIRVLVDAICGDDLIQQQRDGAWKVSTAVLRVFLSYSLNDIAHDKQYDGHYTGGWSRWTRPTKGTGVANTPGAGP